MDAFKSTSAAVALKPALLCHGSKALDGKAKVSILSDAPVTESSSAVLDGIVCPSCTVP